MTAWWSAEKVRDDKKIYQYRLHQSVPILDLLINIYVWGEYVHNGDPIPSMEV